MVETTLPLTIIQKNNTVRIGAGACMHVHARNHEYSRDSTEEWPGDDGILADICVEVRTRTTRTRYDTFLKVAGGADSEDSGRAGSVRWKTKKL